MCTSFRVQKNQIRVFIFLLVFPLIWFFFIFPNLSQAYVETRVTDLATGSYRVDLLLASLSYAAETFPVGLGSQKEYLTIHGGIGVEDLTLRAPDGYFNVMLIRYGFLGAAFFLCFFSYHIALSFKSNDFLKAGSVFIILAVSMVDPILITPINVVLIASIVKGITRAPVY